LSTTRIRKIQFLDLNDVASSPIGDKPFTPEPLVNPAHHLTQLLPPLEVRQDPGRPQSRLRDFLQAFNMLGKLRYTFGSLEG